MITDHTLDQTLIELARTMAALKALRAERKGDVTCIRSSCENFRHILVRGRPTCAECGEPLYLIADTRKNNAAALRASMDLTRKLADLRQGR